jgi:hypothetical protein
MTRGQLVARAGRIMGMARSSTDNTEEVAFLQDLANEAVLNVLSRTKVNIRRVSLELDADVREYDLSQNVIRIWYLNDEDGSPLTEVPEGDLSLYEDGKVFQFVGYNRLVLGWDPSVDDTIEAWYTPRPTPMTDDAHDPALATYGLIPPEFHDGLVNYMCWKAGEATRDQGSGLGEKYRRQYEGEDGTGPMGTNIGAIKWAVNRRGASGAPHGRLRSALYRSGADSGSQTWR